MHAHLAGDAVPLDVGRFTACKGPRVPEKAYRKRRGPNLGESAVTAAVDAASRLEKLKPGTLTEKYFPELALAWRAMEQVRSGASVDAALLDFDCIAVDECQDLTPLESFFLVELTKRINSRRKVAATLLLSGDEAQTVRATDFEWGWLSDLLHSQVGTPSEYKLLSNLRSPQRIAGLVLLRCLPPFYETLAVPDRMQRTERLQQRAIQLLIKDRHFASALEVLQQARSASRS